MIKISQYIVFSFIVYLYLIQCFPIAESKNIAEKKSRQKRVIGGNEASEDLYPYVVSLRRTNGSNHFCGGTHLSDKWILTAAHCVDQLEPSSFFVQIKKYGKFTVDMIFLKQFHPVIFMNDIALLKINIAKHQLVEQNYYTNKRIRLSPHPIQSGSDCYILGYGSSEYAGKPSDTLKIGKLNTITYAECLDKLGRVATPEPHWGMFCAVGDRMDAFTNVDACNGDSGGPLICKNREQNEYYLSGITSYGVGCGKVPGVYTSTYFHNDWILKMIS